MSVRPILERRSAVQTIEGAGVKLHRAFGFQDPSELRNGTLIRPAH